MPLGNHNYLTSLHSYELKKKLKSTPFQFVSLFSHQTNDRSVLFAGGDLDGSFWECTTQTRTVSASFQAKAKEDETREIQQPPPCQRCSDER